MAFPVVESSAAYDAGTTAATTHAVPLPATITAGALLMMVGRSAAAGALTLPAGWTVVTDSSDASDDVSFWAYRDTLADGTEDGTTVTVTHGSGKLAAITYSITGAEDPATSPPQASTVAVGTGSNPGPTTDTPTGGAKDYLWIAVGMADGEHTAPPATIPVNYGSSVGANTGTAGAVGLNARVYSATRDLNAASEDPGTWTTSVAVNTGWTSWTLAAHPAAAVSVTVVAPAAASTANTMTPMVSMTMESPVAPVTASALTGDGISVDVAPLPSVATASISTPVVGVTVVAPVALVTANTRTGDSIGVEVGPLAHAATASSVAPGVGAIGPVTVVAPVALVTANTETGTAGVDVFPSTWNTTATRVAPVLSVSHTVAAPAASSTASRDSPVIPVIATAASAATGTVVAAVIHISVSTVAPATANSITHAADIYVGPIAPDALAENVAPAVSGGIGIEIFAPAAAVTASSVAPVVSTSITRTVVSPATVATAAAQAASLTLSVAVDVRVVTTSTVASTPLVRLLATAPGVTVSRVAPTLSETVAITALPGVVTAAAGSPLPFLVAAFPPAFNANAEFILPTLRFGFLVIPASVAISSQGSGIVSMSDASSNGVSVEDESEADVSVLDLVSYY